MRPVDLMNVVRVLLRTCTIVGLAALVAASAAAQSLESGSIVGRITDKTGGTLPGAAVTVTGPALQVPQLTVTTDGSGEYLFRELRAGLYTVKYELSGFQTVIRQDVRLNVGFAARLDVVMTIGAVEETLTVTGRSPVVDTSTTVGSTNFTSQVLEQTPITRSMWTLLSITPGVVTTSAPDVGGNQTGSQAGYKNYGFSDQNKPVIEGIDLRQGTSAAGAFPDYSTFEEVQVRAVGNDAEVALPGTNFIAIVKSGGNDFHGVYRAFADSTALQSSNLDDGLKALGVTQGSPLKTYNDISGDLGGRIVRNKLWFYTAVARQHVVNGVINYSQAPGPDGIYGTADDVNGDHELTLLNQTIKGSYQPAEKYKIVGYFQHGNKIEPNRGGDTFHPAESTNNFRFVNLPWKGELQATPSDKLLFDVLIARNAFLSEYRPSDVNPGNPSRFDVVTGRYTGVSYGGTSLSGVYSPTRHQWSSVGSVSYFPSRAFLGKHALKAGYNGSWQWYGNEYANLDAGNYALIYASGQPLQFVSENRPVTGDNNRLTEYSGFIKDTWTVNSRVTVNLGLRLDRDHSFVDPQVKAPGLFGTSGNIPAVDVLTWTALAPRVGVAWALDNAGRTVVKGTYGRFNHTMGDAFALNYNQNTVVLTTYRWNDADRNNNYTPGEVNLDTNGPDFVSLIGATNAILTPDLKQPHTDEASLGFERELVANFSARALYVYKRQTNLINTINPLRPSSAFTNAITRPDPGPDGVAGTADDGGLVTLYDYTAQFAGSRFVGQQAANADPEHMDRYQSAEFTLNKRNSHGWDMLASFLATRNHRWLGTTATPQTPNDLFFPLDETWDRQFKLIGSYQLPWNLHISGLFQSTSGTAGQRTYVFRSIPQLATLTRPLEAFGVERTPRINLLNMRLSKRLAISRTRLELSAEVLNAMNVNSATGISFASGPNFGRITGILPPRIARLGATFSF